MVVNSGHRKWSTVFLIQGYLKLCVRREDRLESKAKSEICIHNLLNVFELRQVRVETIEYLYHILKIICDATILSGNMLFSILSILA
jgi:DNA invertase Pin-like site-specific DNA recombinase